VMRGGDERVELRGVQVVADAGHRAGP
jgi:hypothetical protein